MFFIGTFFKRIWSDFTQKELLPLKLLFFVHSSTLYVLYPYLTIHMRALGINVEETAIMSAVTPIVAIVMPPIAGLLADRIGNFKVILSILSGISGAAALLLLMVPVGRETIHFPKSARMQLFNSQGSIGLEAGDSYPCDTLSAVDNVLIKIESCGMTCSLPPFSSNGDGDEKSLNGVKDIVDSKEFQLQIGPNNDTYHYTVSAGIPGVSEVNDSTYFFPTPDLFGFGCRILNETWARCSVSQNDGDRELLDRVTSSPVSYAVLLNPVDKYYGLGRIKLKALGFSDAYRNLSSITRDDEEAEESTLTVLVHGEPIEMRSCRASCMASVPRQQICSNSEMVKEYDISTTFWLYLVIRVFIGMISGTLFPMFEGAVIAILREHKADYGLQRIYATIGGMISSPLSGWLIDYASEKAGYTDFRPAFYLYAVLKIVSALLMLTINLEFKAPATDVLSDVMIVLKKIEIVALLCTCFILGTAWGYIESFLFWLLQDLGASRILMGVTITVGGIAGLPLLVMSGPIIDKIGHANVLFIGFIFYAIRLMGYSLIYNPWMCLIFEAMESVTSSLAFTAAVTYAAKLSTTATDASIQGMVGGLYYGVGKGAGSLFGGYLMKLVGTRPTYQIFSAVTLATGIIYYLFNKFYIVKKTQQDEKAESMEKGCPNGGVGEITKEKVTEEQTENIPMRRNSNHVNNYKSNDTSKCATAKEGNGNLNKGYQPDENDNSSVNEKTST